MCVLVRCNRDRLYVDDQFCTSYHLSYIKFYINTLEYKMSTILQQQLQKVCLHVTTMCWSMFPSQMASTVTSGCVHTAPGRFSIPLSLLQDVRKNGGGDADVPLYPPSPCLFSGVAVDLPMDLWPGVGWPVLTIPLPLFSGGRTSATTAVEMLTFPLLIPPMIRATTKIVKLCESAQSTYDRDTPVCNENNV